jgi:hypothetical protein
MKSAIYIVCYLQTGFALLQLILNESDSLVAKSGKNYRLDPSWRNLVGFECLQVALSDTELIKKMASKNTLIQLLETYSKACAAIEQSKATLEPSQTQTQMGSQRIAKLIDSQYIDLELTQVPVSQIERIIIESLCTFCDSFVHVFKSIGVKMGTSAGSAGREENFATGSYEETYC